MNKVYLLELSELEWEVLVRKLGVHREYDYRVDKSLDNKYIESIQIKLGTTLPTAKKSN